MLAATAAVSAACGAADRHSQPPPSASASATTAVTSTTHPASLHVTLDELAQHPCRALDQQQLADLRVTDNQPQEGGEQEAGFLQCRWETAQGSLLFGAHPSTDVTADPEIARLEPGQLDGHRTMLGVDSALDRCMIFPQAGAQLGMAGCDIIKQLAAAVLQNLS